MTDLLTGLQQKGGGTHRGPAGPVEPAPALRPPAERMAETALVFLDDPVARRLAVAWVTCGGDEDTWFEAAGLPQRADAVVASRALRLNGVCRDGGVTDQLALGYIAALVAEPLERRKARGKGKR